MIEILGRRSVSHLCLLRGQTQKIQSALFTLSDIERVACCPLIKRKNSGVTTSAN